MAIRRAARQLIITRGDSTKLTDPFRSVSVIHYLYCLTIAAEYGLAIGDVYKELMVFLEKGSLMERTLEHYDAVPELLSIFRYCQELVYSRTK